MQTFRDADQTMKEHAVVFGHTLNSLGPEPILCDLYTPLPEQKHHEIAFLVVGMAATGAVAYYIAQW